MISFYNRYKFFILLTVIFLVSEVIVNPFRDFPLNDDWSYAKSVMVLHNEWHINVGNWGAMTLLTHLFWGVLFTKAFGFSFMILRVSTLVSSFIGISVLFLLVKRITTSERIAFFASMVLLFNPLYYNLSNTFMTDVNFNTLIILFIYVSFRFFEGKKTIHLLWIAILSGLLVFLRQFGIVAPVCFGLACLFLEKRRWLYVAAAAIITLAVFAALKWYESTLGYLEDWSPYKFSGSVKFDDPVFWQTLFKNFGSRYKTFVVQVIIYISAFVFLFFGSALKWPETKNEKWKLFAILSGCILFCVFLFDGGVFPSGNIFMNIRLGPETFYESWTQTQNHSHSRGFPRIVNVLKYIFAVGVIFILVQRFKGSHFRKATLSSPTMIFFLALFLGYVAMLFISESTFDRYQIPLISIALVALAWIFRHHHIRARYELFPLILFTYISVAGTLDYLTLNDYRWIAYRTLAEKNISTVKINGGFEINCWNDGELNWYYDFNNLDKFDYLIQFKQEPGFKLYREYPFQRYFPYKKDKINIFVREGLNPQ